ncbi:hypothetical protein [Bacillus sp. FJAT-18017]|nr:hypothetical protein [Bacillus sp. FJAT-18017]
MNFIDKFKFGANQAHESYFKLINLLIQTAEKEDKNQQDKEKGN